MALLKGFLSSFSHIVKSQWVLVLLAGEHYVQPCSCARFHYEREEEDRWTFFWNPPSTRPNSVCFSRIQSTHSEETHMTAASVLGHPFYSNTRVSFCETSLKSSPCERAHPFRGLSQRLVLLIHYRDHHFYLLHIPAWAPHPNPNTSHIHTHTHAQHKTTLSLSSGNNDEAWWQRQAAERRSRLHWSAICGTNGFWDSSSPSDGQPDFLGCLGTLRPPAPCSTLIVWRNAHRRPTLFVRQKLERKKSEYTVDRAMRGKGSPVCFCKGTDTEVTSGAFQSVNLQNAYLLGFF